MRHIVTLTLLAFGLTSAAQTTHELTASDFVFTPATLNIDAGDNVHVTLGSTHTCTEVTETTWNANGETSNGGFNFGDGTPNPGSEHTFTLAVPGTYWYVCQPHVADHGMKGIIIVAPTSIEEAGSLPLFELAPNPARTETVVLLASSPLQYRALVYDAQGRRVLSTELKASRVLDLSLLDPGAFTVLLADREGVPLARRQLVIVR